MGCNEGYELYNDECLKQCQPGEKEMIILVNHAKKIIIKKQSGDKHILTHLVPNVL